jgi:hypothetical protein
MRLVIARIIDGNWGYFRLYNAGADEIRFARGVVEVGHRLSPSNF